MNAFNNEEWGIGNGEWSIPHSKAFPFGEGGAAHSAVTDEVPAAAALTHLNAGAMKSEYRMK